MTVMIAKDTSWGLDTLPRAFPISLQHPRKAHLNHCPALTSLHTGDSVCPDLCVIICFSLNDKAYELPQTVSLRVSWGTDMLV